MKIDEMDEGEGDDMTAMRISTRKKFAWVKSEIPKPQRVKLSTLDKFLREHNFVDLDKYPIEVFHRVEMSESDQVQTNYYSQFRQLVPHTPPPIDWPINFITMVEIP